MSIKDYPDDSKINSETGRNKEAVLYLMERAWCPVSVLGAAVRQARCGAFDDDLEVSRGWAVNPDGTDTAPTAARFTRSNPDATSRSGIKQRGDHPVGIEGVRDRCQGRHERILERPRRADDAPLPGDSRCR